MAIGLGTSVVWNKSSRYEAEKLAKALDGVTQKGTRSLWYYPDHGDGRGSPRQFGSISLEYVCVYWDGRSVWLDMVGPGAPNDTGSLANFMSSIGVRINGQPADMKSNTTI